MAKKTAVKTPESIKPHESDYKAQAWDAYTFAELGQWVHLLTTRAGHRSDTVKRDKDLYDARNYLEMAVAKLDAIQGKP